MKQGRTSNLAFLICAVGLLLSLLAGTALAANQQALERGIPPGLPDPVAEADVSPFCINVALEQYPALPAVTPPGGAGSVAAPRTALGLSLQQALELVTDGGFVWVRQDFPWAAMEPAPGRYEWTTWDRIVAAVAAQGLRLIAVLDQAPAWAGSPPRPADFARFAGALAERYGQQIDHYQIWHNPNLSDGWGAPPNAAAYAELLRQATQAIRTADPQARILLGSLAPTREQGPDNLTDLAFLRALYAAGAGPYFDIASVQPYGFDTGPDDRRVGEGVLNFSRALLLREEMIAHGDQGKAVWASHFGWNSLPAQWNDFPSIWGQVDQATQAAYTGAAMQRAREEWPWMGVLCLAHLQPHLTLPNPPSGVPDARRHWGFALLGPDGQPRPVYRAVASLAHQPALNYPGAYTARSGTATWQGDWEFSDLGADPSPTGGERVTIPFWGTDLGLRVRRGNYRAYLFVTVDGAPANRLPRDETGRAYLVLTSPDYQPQTVTVPVATRLTPGPHTAVVVPERGWDQWPLVGWTVAYHPQRTAYCWSLTALGLVAAACLAGLLAAKGRQPPPAYHRLSARWRSLSDGLQMLVTGVTTALLWASAWMTWGTEAGNSFRRLGDGVGLAATLAALGLFYYSPWFLLTVLSGLVLFVLVLLRLDLALALIAALAPFYGFPWTLFSKAFSLAEVLTLMALVSWARARLAASRGARASPRALASALAALRGLDLAVLLLVIIALGSTCQAQFQRVAWRELRLVILEPAAFYLMLRTAGLDRRALWRVADFFVLGGVVVALIGLTQYAMGVNLITAEGGLPRLRSVYGSPNNVGLYLGRVLPLVAAVALLARHRRRRLLYGLAAVPVAAALLLSFSKGALFLGIPASLLTIGLLAGGRWAWATLIAVATAGMAAIPLLRLPRFASLLDTQGGTTFFRLKLWRATLSMIGEHFWLGVGPDNFLYHYRGRYILPEAWQEPDLSHPHNFLLDHWARLGVFGAVAGLWLQAGFWRLALPLRRLRDRDARALALGLMGGMADTLAHGLVDHSFFLIDLAFVFFMALAMTVALADGRLSAAVE